MYTSRWWLTSNQLQTPHKRSPLTFQRFSATCFPGRNLKNADLGWAQTTCTGRDSSLPHIPFDMFSIFDSFRAKWGLLKKKKTIFTFNIHSIFFILSELLSLYRTHPHKYSGCRLSSLVGPPALPLGGLMQAVMCRQPVGIGLTVWQTVILDITHTLTKRQVHLMHCDPVPYNNQKEESFVGKLLLR